MLLDKLMRFHSLDVTDTCISTEILNVLSVALLNISPYTTLSIGSSSHPECSSHFFVIDLDKGFLALAIFNHKGVVCGASSFAEWTRGNKHGELLNNQARTIIHSHRKNAKNTRDVTNMDILELKGFNREIPIVFSKETLASLSYVFNADSEESFELSDFTELHNHRQTLKKAAIFTYSTPH